MLPLTDQALLIKLFYMNGETATVALQKFCTEKGLKSTQAPISRPAIMKSVHCYEQKRRLEDCSRSNRPSLTEGNFTAVQSDM